MDPPGKAEMFGIKTAAQAEDAYNEARSDLAKAAADGGDMAAAMGQVAYWSGFAKALHRVEQLDRQLDDHGIDGMRKQFALMQAVAELLAAGADDTWSGRGNDQARREFDGKRDATQVAMRAIQQAADALI